MSPKLSIFIIHHISFIAKLQQINCSQRDVTEQLSSMLQLTTP